MKAHEGADALEQARRKLKESGLDVVPVCYDPCTRLGSFEQVHIRRGRNGVDALIQVDPEGRVTYWLPAGQGPEREGAEQAIAARLRGEG